MTFEQYQRELIEAAKDIQGENYVGDAYYMDDCWRESFERYGDKAMDAVLSDMSYWEPIG